MLSKFLFSLLICCPHQYFLHLGPRKVFQQLLTVPNKVPSSEVQERFFPVSLPIDETSQLMITKSQFKKRRVKLALTCPLQDLQYFATSACSRKESNIRGVISKCMCLPVNSSQGYNQCVTETYGQKGQWEYLQLRELKNF